MAARSLSLQDHFLNSVRRAKLPVTIFLVKGVKLQGVVTLYAEVDVDGRLRSIRVTRGLGLGLEEKAIEAVRQWRFRPGMRDGRPIVSAATIEVNFHLL